MAPRPPKKNDNLLVHYIYDGVCWPILIAEIPSFFHQVTRYKVFHYNIVWGNFAALKKITLAITICWKLAPGKEGDPVTGPKPFQQKMFRSIEVVATTTTTITSTTIPAATTTTATTTATTTTITTITTTTTTTTTSMTYEREGWCRKQQNPVKRYGPPRKTITLQKHTRQL